MTAVRIYPFIIFLCIFQTAYSSESSSLDNSLAVSCPGTQDKIFPVSRKSPWKNIRNANKVRFSLQLKGTGRLRGNAVLFVKTTAGLWYQSQPTIQFNKESLQRNVSLDLTSQSAHWIPGGHQYPWGADVRRQIAAVGIRFWSRFPCKGKLLIKNIKFEDASSNPSESVPSLRIYGLNSEPNILGPHQLFQIQFQMKGSIDQHWIGSAEFTDPKGQIYSVPDFPYQDYFLYQTSTGTQLRPTGPPVRLIRFRPAMVGTWNWRLQFYAKENPSDKNSKPRIYSGQFLCVENGPKGMGYSPKEAKNILTQLGASALFPKAAWTKPGGPKKSVTAYSLEPNPDKRTSPLTISEIGMRFPLEWDQRWYGFGGLDVVYQELAWKMDRLLESLADDNSKTSYPWILLDGNTLEGQGTFNWFSNPLSKTLNGPAPAPGTLFHNPNVLNAVVRRMRREIGRYGHSPVLGQPLFAVDLNAPHAVAFHQKLTAKVIPWLSATKRRPMAIHPELSPNRNAKTVASFEEARPQLQRAKLGWKIFKDVAPTTKAGRLEKGISPNDLPKKKWASISKGSQAPAETTEGNRAAFIYAEFPKEAAVRWVMDESWYDVNAVTIDIKLPDDAPDDVRLQVTFRDGTLLWYERLLPELIRKGDWNRLTVPLSNQSASEWTAIDHERPFGWWSRTRVRELGFRFHSKTSWKGLVWLDNVSLIRSKTPQVPAKENLFTLVSSPKENGRVFEWSEWVLQVPAGAANPYNPQQLDIIGEFTDSSGNKILRPAFYYEPYRMELKDKKENFIPTGIPDFRVRFAPVKKGEYSVRFLLYRSKKETAEIKAPPFTAETAVRSGFIRISKKDPRWFETSDGKFFYPIGHNLRSPSDERNKKSWDFALPDGNELQTVTDILISMGKAGENYTRMWMASWWLGLEWDRRHTGYHGTGRYNTQNAWMMDRVMEAAEAAGVRIEWVLNYHGQWNRSVYDCEWLFNPYNKIEHSSSKFLSRKNQLIGDGMQWERPGGFLPTADLVFTNPRCQSLLRQRYRYVLARWGASTSVFSWALWNEVNVVDGYAGKLESWKDPHKRVVKWHQFTTRWLNNNDPYKHPVTTQFNTTKGDPAVWKLPEIGYTQVASYNWGAGCLETIQSEVTGVGDGKNPQRGTPDSRRRITGYKKPALCDEFGGNVYGGPMDVLEEELHIGLWGSIMLPISGTAQFWWWNFVHQKNLYPHFAAVAAFMKDEDFRGWNDQLDGMKLSANDSKTLKIFSRSGNQKAIGWVVHKNVTKTKFVKGKFTKAAKAPNVGAGKKVYADKLKTGSYTVEIWDTFNGKPISTKTIKVGKTGKATIVLPAFKSDMAFKVFPKK